MNRLMVRPHSSVSPPQSDEMRRTRSTRSSTIRNSLRLVGGCVRSMKSAEGVSSSDSNNNNNEASPPNRRCFDHSSFEDSSHQFIEDLEITIDSSSTPAVVLPHGSSLRFLPLALSPTRSTSSASSAEAAADGDKPSPASKENLLSNRFVNLFVRSRRRGKSHLSSSNINAAANDSAMAPVEEECPLCCNDMSPCDQVYQIKCPVSSCQFNFCTDCLVALLKSYNDGYQEASDGSRQVRVWLQCPQCRGKYQSPLPPVVAPVITPEVILRSYHSLRYAYKMTPLVSDLTTKDSDRTATDLQRRNEFTTTFSLDMLRTAYTRVELYQRDIGILQPLPPLDWQSLSKVLPTSAPIPAASSSSSTTTAADQQQQTPWKDPTVFMGLDDLMNDSEQEFVTQLLTSGHADGLAQAALILHSILNMAATGRAIKTVQELSSTATDNAPRATASASRQRSTTTGSSASSKQSHKAVCDLHKIRGLYPLPRHMPTCVALPIYDPSVTKPVPLIQFASKPPNSLVISAVKGVAGRLGLRKGDVVTHINGEDVMSQFDFCQHLQFMVQQQAQQNEQQDTVMLVVNANEETARALKERADKMKQANVRFYR